MGEEGWRWFVAKVEDIMDPMQLGRVRLRVINDHDHPNIQTTDLPWAFLVQAPTSAALNGIGHSPTGLLVGSTVFGFYLDGQEKQLPMVLGSYAKLTAGTSDVSPLATGTNSFPVNPVGPEPPSAYAAKYPFNNVYQSQSGHTVEFDDTPGNERIRTRHMSGSYEEINNEGRRVKKTVGSDIEVVVKDKTVYIQGNCNVQINGNATVKISGTANISASSVVVAGNVEVDGNLVVNGNSNLNGNVLFG